MTTAATRFVSEILESREDFRTFWETYGIVKHGLNDADCRALNAMAMEAGEGYIENYEAVRQAVKQLHNEIAGGTSL